MNNEKLLLSKREAALALGVSQQTLDRLTKSEGGPRPSRLGRRVLYTRTELERFAGATVAA